jgi:hypothetical protein
MSALFCLSSGSYDKFFYYPIELPMLFVRETLIKRILRG